MSRRRVGDVPPATPVALLLASDGQAPFSAAAVQQARRLAGHGPGGVGVVTIARIYGFTLGIPHPGLLPTPQELEARRIWLAEAITAVEADGHQVDGELALTRHHARQLASIAARRSVTAVVLDVTSVAPVRRLLEGDIATGVRRRLSRRAIPTTIVRDGETTAACDTRG